MKGPKTEVRDLKRLDEILHVFYSEGLGFMLDRLNLEGRIPAVKRVVTPRDIEPTPERIRETFEELGPTFIKFGQILAERPDIVPEEYRKELEKLEDDVPAFDSEKAKYIVQEEVGLGKFSKFNEEPIAAASIAQVHEAWLESGEKVAVKIRRPGIKNRIERDLDILNFLASRAEKHVSLMKDLKAAGAMKQFSKWTLEELDLSKEARNADILRKNLENEERIEIPKMYHELTTEKVLVMEFAEGVKCEDEEALRELDVEAEDVARTGIRSGLKQIMRDGFFHADPHPSNFLVTGEGHLMLLDFGMVGRLSKDTRRNVGLLFLHAWNEDIDAVVEALQNIGYTRDDADVEAIKADIEDTILELKHSSLQDKSIAKSVFELIKTAGKHGIHLPASLTVMGKSLITVEGIVLTIYPESNIGDEYERTVKRIIYTQNSPKDMAEGAFLDLIQNKDLVTGLGTKLNKLLEQKDGKTVVKHDTDIKEPVIAGALLISSALMLSQTSNETLLTNLSLLELAVAGYLLYKMF